MFQCETMNKTHVEIENLSLDGVETKIEFFPKELLNTRYTNDLEHMVKQLFTHGRLGGKVRIYLEQGADKGLWGYVGRELGKEIGRLLRSRRNIYGYGFSMVTFEGALSIGWINISSNPSSQVALIVPDEEYKQLIPEVKEFFGYFSDEANLNIQSFSFPVKTLFDLQYNDMRCVDPTDGHHVVESLFKNFSYGFHLLKSQKTKSIFYTLPEDRKRVISKERNTHETQISLLFNLDGQGKYINSNVEIRVPSEAIEAFERSQSFFSNGSKFDQICEKKLLGDEEHHFMEDYGIVQGEALLESLGDKKGIFRFGNDIVECLNCRERVIVATDLPGTNRACLTASLYDEPWRNQYLLFHYLKSLTRSAGVDAFIGQYLEFKNLERLFNKDDYASIISLFDPNSEYHLPANSIKGSYSLQTSCDSPYHRNEILMTALGRSLKQSTSIDRVKIDYIASTKGVLD